MKNSCNKVIDILDRLLAPNGCAWDREQTLLTLRETVLEEICELIDAINSGDKEHIKEELGDLLFNALFFAKVAEKENVTTFDGVVDELADKLIRRHPHVFEEAKQLSSSGVVEQWEKIKKNEKGKIERTLFEGIPAGLPALARAQKMSKRMKKQGVPVPEAALEGASPVGLALWGIIQQAQREGVDAEQELRTILEKIDRLS